MLTSGEPFDEDGNPNPVIGAILPTLSSGGLPLGHSDATAAGWQTAERWQDLGPDAHTFDLALKARSRAVKRGRGTEIFGRGASMGEQLSIATTAASDAQSWIERRKPDAHQSMAVRALSDLSVLNLISVGHGLINISARIVNVQGETGWTPKRPEQNAYWAGIHVPPFGPGPWIALTKDNARDHRHDAAALDLPDVTRLAEAVTTLVRDARWRDRVPSRNEDFHGWRAQSIDGGVPKENPWTVDDTSVSIEIDGQVTGHTPPDPVKVVAETQAMITAVAAALDTWHDALPAALSALELPVLEW